MNTLREIITEHIRCRKQIWKLAKSDLIKTYKGSALGWAWAIIKPTITLCVYWFAFSIGLKSGKPVEGYPYFLWLMAGLIPWFYMRSMLPGGASSLRRYTFLVTKIKYPICTIPTFVSISYFIVHCALVVFMLLMYMARGFFPDIYYLQLPLYMLMNFVFFTAWGLFGSMLSAISRDFQNFIKSITLALMWLSGIFYRVENINIPWLRTLLSFNPITIIVNGYRKTLVYKEWFWESPQDIINYLIVLVVMVTLAVWAYKKLRKDIPDVL